MVKRKLKCKYGKLSSPVREPKTGFIRRCKLKKKSPAGRKQDRKKRSGEAHEVRYRIVKRARR